ncbi:MAG: heme ABC transporter ATP-binding protein, partial [Anaerolineaceae bacterium]|nr:heme ABC transporter ATP-binding protein [Anaerolineaceae bacterium]
SDRIAVMYRGKIIAIVNADEVTKEEVGLLMAGVHLDIKPGEKKAPTKIESTL